MTDLIANIKHARKLVTACEYDLGYKLDAGQIGDLLSDKTEWSRETINEVRAVIIRAREGKGEQHDG